MNTNIRGRVAIVARGVDENALVDGRVPDPKAFPHPALLGYVEILDCLKIARRHLGTELRQSFGKSFQNFYPRHYIPEKGPVFLWILGSAKALGRPRKFSSPPRSRVWMRL
jgi:hypothetical protein